jgi:hypothetical protein
MIEAADENPRDLVLVLLLFVSALRQTEVGRVRVDLTLGLPARLGSAS